MEYVEIKVAATGLRGRKADPFAVLLRKDGGGWREIGRTEVVWMDANPAFVKGFEVREGEEEYRIVVCNKNGKSEEIRKNGFLGMAEFTLDRALRKVDGVIERVLRNGKGKMDGKRGRLIICAERVKWEDVKHMFSIQLGVGKESGVWGKEGGKKAKKVFYVIYRAILNGVADEDWTPVYRSEILDVWNERYQDVMFEGASIRSEHLYGNDENRALRFELFHYNPSGAHVPIGFVQTSASAFKYAQPGGLLYVVPVPGSTMKTAHVVLEMAKIGLTTRRGGMSSLFCLKAKGFVWGNVEEGDDYLERDAYGRTRIEFGDGYMLGSGLPRGVSYLKSRKVKEEGEEDE